MPIVEREGSLVAYQRTGRGPAVLWLQGVGVIGDGWRPQLEALAGSYTCVTVDNRGIGASTPAARDVSIEALANDA